MSGRWHLMKIIRVGTSAGGAQAQAVVGWNRETGQFLTGCHSSVEDKDFEAWSNPHVLSVNGKTGLIADDDLLAVAEKFGIGTAKRVLGEVKEAVAGA